MVRYSVKQLAKLAGVSVRTLHLYDQLGLLKPSTRTEARYRLYGEKELLRLQQILFYKELDFPLQEIAAILDDPEFDLLSALSNHKKALNARRERMATLMVTIDKTINHLKTGGTMLKPEELYEGLPKETAEAYRKEAIKKYGKKAIEDSENQLRKLSKEQLAQLRKEQLEISAKFATLIHEDHTSEKVQREVARHYEITRKFWGTHSSADTQAEAYSGLGQLYVTDERFTMIDGKPQPEFALFLSKAMSYFAATKLK